MLGVSAGSESRLSAFYKKMPAATVMRHWKNGYGTKGFLLNWIVKNKDPDFMYEFYKSAKHCER